MQESFAYESSMQHSRAGVAVVSARGVPAAVQKHKAERHARGFTCWGQFVAMLFCQLGQAKSLREICNGLMSIEGKLKHLGIDSAPNKSTLDGSDCDADFEIPEAEV